MTFSLSVMAREITAAVNLCAQIVDQSGKIPILRATRIDASARVLMATNSEQTISVKIACEGEGIACIDTPALLAKVQTLKQDAAVEFHGDGKSVTITQGRTRWTAPCLLDDFPKLPVIKGKKTGLSAEFMMAVNRVYSVIDINYHPMPQVLGVLLAGSMVFASNGKCFRIEEAEGPEDIILPKVAAAKLASMFPEGAQAIWSANQCEFISDTVTLRTQLLSGQYPDIHAIMDKFIPVLAQTCTVDAAALVAGIKRGAAIRASGEKSLSFLNMRLTFKSGEVEIYTRNIDGEEGIDYVPAECDAEATVGFNGYELLEEIESLGEGMLEILYADEKNPVLIQKEGSQRFIQGRIFR